MVARNTKEGEFVVLVLCVRDLLLIKKLFVALDEILESKFSNGLF